MSGFTTTSIFPGTIPKSQALTAVLAATFFGAFTMIAPPALYVISRKGLGRISSLAAFTTTAALYVLATIYAIAVLVTVFHNTQILDRDYGFHTPTLDAIGTAVLTITTVLSDAVVWSRVWVLWGHNKILYGISLMVLMATLILGGFSTAEHSGYDLYKYNGRVLWMGGFYWSSDTGDTGLIVCWLSMSINALAIIFYLIKVLRMRSANSKAANLSTGRRVARHFVRIMESGTLFAVIWLLVALYNSGTGEGGLAGTDGVSFFVNGALIPLLGAFAVLIMVLAATGYSETAFLDDAADDEQSLPLSREK